MTKKPHVTCYDMECDECVEAVSCCYVDEEDIAEPEPLEEDVWEVMAKLQERMDGLTHQFEILAATVHKVKEQFETMVAALIRAANEEER